MKVEPAAPPCATANDPLTSLIMEVRALTAELRTNNEELRTLNAILARRRIE